MYKKCLFLVLWLFASCAHAATEIPETNSIERQFRSYQQSQRIPGMAVHLYSNGELQSFYLGYADQENQKNIDQNTIFKLGKVSELFTALLLAKQINVGRLQLDYKVNKYVSNLSPAFMQISLMQLATQTSGLPSEENRGLQSQRDLQQFLEHWQHPQEASQYYSDSALNYDILAMVIKKRQKNWLNNMLKKYVLLPLKMQPIATSIPKNLKNNLSKGYDSNNQVVKKQQSQLFEASFGLFASAKDMQHFLAATIGLGDPGVDMLYPIRMTQVAYVDLANRQQGLGWNIYSLNKNNLSYLFNGEINPEVKKIPEIPTYDKNKYFDKFGQIDGFTSYIAVMPSRQSGIVILANKQLDKHQLVSMTRHILLGLNQIDTSDYDNNNPN